MSRRFTALCGMMLFISSLVFAQGLTTSATKDDWEEINFEFNMSVLTDGYPSLLRIAELLNQNPGHKVKIAGHTDWIGSHPFNDKLGAARAATVKSFLEKYGARAGQVTVESKGEGTPKVDNNTKLGRWMNRRVLLTVTDANGKIIGAGGAGDVLKALDALAKKQEECCSQILRRLDKLDEILDLLKDLKNENAKLRGDVDALKSAQQAGAQAAAGAGAAQSVSTGPSTSQLNEMADRAAHKAIDSNKIPKFSLMGLNAGPDGTGNLTFTGRGQYFSPVSKHTALQLQGEYMYFRGRKEGQFDAGIVNRWKDIQLGSFASFKAVTFKEFQNTGALGQAAFTFDYLFSQGRIGVFGTKAFLDNAIVNRVQQRNLLTENYLSVVDQAGGSGAVNLSKRVWLEGNLGYLRSRAGNSKPGGTLRFVFPVNHHFAFTAEGGVNETMITNDTNGRAVFGILFGNFMHPREYKAADHPVPVDVPRVRYEVLTRTTRTGNDPPVADAGPDQTGAPAGTINLDGSASFDPDGDPITFQWSQIAGPAVTLSAPTANRTSFTAAAGNVYSFRLTVKDDRGAQGIARVTITTRETPRVRILRFTANPTLIRSGQQSTLNWLVENADTVTISGVTTALNPGTGSVPVSPTETTSYTLTARNRVSEDTAVVTVVVEQPQPRILRFTATPATILQGEASTLDWQTQDADSVEIPNVGTFAPNGSVVVSPDQTTAYTLIARNRFGETTASTVVTVQTGPKPSVISFSATPVEIVAGDPSTLAWQVQNADEVTITSLGTVQASGSVPVTPNTTTTYTLTATNKFGTATSTATVVVYPRLRILSFTATPNTIKSGQPVLYAWSTENANDVVIECCIGPRPVNGSLTNAGPISTTTYTLTATGRLGQRATATVTVTVDNSGTAGGKNPTARIAGNGEIVTAFRDIILDGTSSSDPDGNILTYSWRVTHGLATISDVTSARPRISLIRTDYGNWRFELTVTNPSGLSSAATTKVILVLSRPQ
ncbi:MAG: OmpA family protein [Acidobacteriia bacterium]|nr:OmpA family protein [Terriglobia bacterium]